MILFSKFIKIPIFVWMILTNYIRDLLYRYECVIVPNFGGFVTKKTGSKIDAQTHALYPPTKHISFNTNLKHNDGLLANYIVAIEKISYEEALKKIEFVVNSWLFEIKKSPITFDNIGVLSFNENKQFIFEPKNTANYLTSSFGLTSLTSETIRRSTSKTLPLVPVFYKYAAASVLVISLAFAGWNFTQNREQQTYLTMQEKALEQEIQQATFVISNPLPTIELKVAKKVIKKYHLIAGAFRYPKNAAKKVAQLQQKGFNPTVIGTNRWGLSQVAFKSFTSRKEAATALKSIQKNIAKDAWLLVKELP